MPLYFLIGLGAGLVSAVALASATAGPLVVRYLLFFIAPLPIALAGLGWGSRAGLVAGLAGSAVIAFTGNPGLLFIFAVTLALPIVILTYLSQMYRTRPDIEDKAATIEWYPAGRLVIWSGVIAGLMSLAVLVMLGGTVDGISAHLKPIIEGAIKEGLPQLSTETPVGPADVENLTKVAVALLPAGVALSLMSGLLFNLWLAGRITNASGQLARPWPDLAAIAFPNGAALALAATTLASFLPGLPGLAAAGFAGALFFAYMLLGLAVLHFVTRGQAWRPFALWALYAALLLINSGLAIIIALVGLAETFLQLRSRTVPPRGPAQ